MHIYVFPRLNKMEQNKNATPDGWDPFKVRRGPSDDAPDAPFFAPAFNGAISRLERRWRRGTEMQLKGGRRRTSVAGGNRFSSTAEMSETEV